MRNNDIRMMVKEALDNLWAHVKTMFSGLDTRVTALEQGGGGGGAVSGVKGNAESTYRTGQVNLTPANIGAKATQSAVSDPTASGTGLTFIDSITQDAQGVITPTKKTVQTATQSADGVMSSTDKAKLDGIAAGAEVNSITGVKGDAESSYRTGNVNLTPANIGAPANTDLTSIIATGTTNATGATITKGTYFYLNGTLVQAKADIASGATFTSGTNYEAVTAGGLNALQSQKVSTVGEWWTRTNWMPSAEQGVLQVSYDANTITIAFSTASKAHLENDVLFTVPSEFRPKIQMQFPVYVTGGYINMCTISTDGNAKLWVNTPTASNSIRGTVTYLYNVI